VVDRVDRRITLNRLCRENWQSGEANRKRGANWLAQIYRHNDASTADRMAAHKDLRKRYDPGSISASCMLTNEIRMAVY
jgi:hypothetical protein